MLSAALANVMLEALLAGREPASINTRIPGWTYASATVMKIYLVAGVVAAVIAFVHLARWRSLPTSERSPSVASDDRPVVAKSIPIWGSLSVILPPFASVIGALAVLIAQVLVDMPDGASPSYLSVISRKGVLVMLAWISASMLLGILSLLKREYPRSLALFGVVTSACLIGLFWYSQFYKLGFDQDRWATP